MHTGKNKSMDLRPYAPLLLVKKKLNVRTVENIEAVMIFVISDREIFHCSQVPLELWEHFKKELLCLSKSGDKATEFVH